MPLFWLSLAFLCGILCAAALSLSSQAWLVLGSVSIIFIILQWRIPHINQFLSTLINRFLSLLHIRSVVYPSSIGFFMLLGFAVGGYRYVSSSALNNDPLNVIHYANHGEVLLKGWIIKPPDERDNYTAVVVQVETIQFKNPASLQETPAPSAKIHGYVLARLTGYQTWHYGDQILLDGELVTPPELDDFSYRAYLARQNIFAYFPKAKASLLQRHQGNWFLRLIFNLRTHAEHTIKQIFPEPQAALLCGILLGIESGIPKYLQYAFINSGTAHIIAISGFNITLLAGLFMAIFSRLLGRWRGALVSFSLIALYTILVGANASVVRAALMGGLTLLAAQIGRRQSGINSLTFLAALMAAFQPSILWDVSFQLSFAATLGLVLYATPLTEKWILFLERLLPAQRAQQIGSASSEWLLFTLAAQLTTLPIILYHFQRLSLISLIANPLILPVQPLLMVLSGIALLGGMVFQPLGQLLAYVAYPVVAYTIRMVELFGNVPYNSILLNPLPLYIVALFYLTLLILTFTWQSLNSFIKQISPIFAIVSLSIIASLTWQTVSRKPDGLLHLILLDVNQSTRSGEALLIQTPQGRYVLIDGGPSKPNLLSALDEWMPITWRKIDWLIIAGVYDNQLSALPELVERQRVARAWWAISNWVSVSAAALQEELKSQQVPIILAQPNQELDLGTGIRLKVIATNKSGALLLLEWDQFRAFLPIGFDSNTRDEVLQSATFPSVTVWLLANRGAEWLNPSTLLARLQPNLILINAAKGEWSGLPDIEMIQSLEGQNVLRSDKNGWVHISTNGRQMWVEAEKYP